MNETIQQRHERQAQEQQSIRNWDGRTWLAKTMLGHHVPLIRPVKVDALPYHYQLSFVKDANGKVKGVPYSKGGYINSRKQWIKAAGRRKGIAMFKEHNRFIKSEQVKA